MIRSAKYIFIIIALGFVSPATAQDRVHLLDSIYGALYAKKKFNGNILVADKGQIIYQKSFGIANEATGEMLNENSVFELASVSKQFTATAIMMLKEKGKLSLDDNIGKYIPELAFYGNVTVRNLLNHTGGLPDYMGLMDSLFDHSKIATNKDIIVLFAKHHPAVEFAPGTKYEYSNTGYALLASIIEKVSGISYAQYLATNIFKPLGMTNSFVYTRRLAPRKINSYAFGYIFSKEQKKYILPDADEDNKMVIFLDGIVGDGTVNSTAPDLLKWDRALYTDKLISKADVQEMYTPATLSNMQRTQYGMGWMTDSTKNCGRFVDHSGGWPGYSTYIERHLDNDKTIIILDNHSDGGFPVFATRKIVYNKSLKSKQREAIVLSPGLLAEYVGEYELSEGILMKIMLENGALKTQLGEQNAFPIFAESKDNFFLKIVDAQLEFLRDNDGKINKVILHQNGNNTQAYKIK